MNEISSMPFDVPMTADTQAGSPASDAIPAIDKDAIQGAAAPEPVGAERRQHARKNLRGKAYVLLGKRDPIMVRTLDVSISGLCIVTPINPPLNLQCGIRFAVPTKPQGAILLEAQAKVVYSVFSADEDGFKVGLQFTRTVELLRALTNFIGV